MHLAQCLALCESSRSFSGVPWVYHSFRADRLLGEYLPSVGCISDFGLGAGRGEPTV